MKNKNRDDFFIRKPWIPIGELWLLKKNFRDHKFEIPNESVYTCKANENKKRRNDFFNTMNITKQTTATKILRYLQHKIQLSELVDWAENAIMDGHFQSNETKILREVLGKIGVADVKTFGLTCDDCETLMHKLGYKIKGEALLAA